MQAPREWGHQHLHNQLVTPWLGNHTQQAAAEICIVLEKSCKLVLVLSVSMSTTTYLLITHYSAVAQYQEMTLYFILNFEKSIGFSRLSLELLDTGNLI